MVPHRERAFSNRSTSARRYLTKTMRSSFMLVPLAANWIGGEVYAAGTLDRTLIPKSVAARTSFDIRALSTE